MLLDYIAVLVCRGVYCSGHGVALSSFALNADTIAIFISAEDPVIIFSNLKLVSKSFIGVRALCASQVL